MTELGANARDQEAKLFGRSMKTKIKLFTQGSLEVMPGKYSMTNSKPRPFSQEEGNDCSLQLCRNVVPYAVFT